MESLLTQPQRLSRTARSLLLEVPTSGLVNIGKLVFSGAPLKDYLASGDPVTQQEILYSWHWRVAPCRYPIPARRETEERMFGLILLARYNSHATTDRKPSEASMEEVSR